MPRAPRIHQPHSLYHVVSRGVERRDIFRTDQDRHVFLAYLDEALRACGAYLLPYCLMSNHYHLLIAIETVPLEIIMQRLLTRYALYFNGVHERVGHLFQGRYYATICASDEQIIQTIAYIHLNPVRAGLSRHPSQWQWSSYDELTSGEKRRLNLSWLLESVGLSSEELRESHAIVIERHMSLMEDDSVAPESRDLSELARMVAARYGINADKLTSGSRERALTPAKKAFVGLATRLGYSDSEIALVLRCSRSGVSHLRESE